MKARKVAGGGIEISSGDDTIRIGVSRKRQGSWCRIVVDPRTGIEVGYIRSTARGWISYDEDGKPVGGPFTGPTAMRDAAATSAGWEL